MRSTIAATLALLGAASAQSSTSTNSTGSSSTVLSFAHPFGEGVIPTGVTGSVVGVASARTTLAYTCAKAAKDVTDYGKDVGILCPMETNTGMTVTYGDGFFAQSTTTLVETMSISTTAEINMECAVTAAPASNTVKPTPVATKDPVCKYDFGNSTLAGTMAALAECSQEDVAGPASEVMLTKMNTASVTKCFASAMKNTAPTADITYKASDVAYWTVIVTDVAKGVNLDAASSSATGSAASASATAKDNAAADSFGARLSAAGVVGLVAGVLAL